MTEPSRGICYGCRHADDERPDCRTMHCLGTGDLTPTPEVRWPGFVCLCSCRINSGHAAPDFLWTIALILFIIVALRMLGVL